MRQNTQVSYFPSQGGVNLSDPPWALDPGSLLLGFNYECAPDGYRRIDGYERFDGQVAPSAGDGAIEIEANRAAIGAVPGAGPVRGVWVYNNVVYAFRDNVGQTECKMYKSTASGWSLVTTPTLSPGGRYEFMNHNFYGSTSTFKMYGVDGVNKGFEFDGTTFSQITTGMTTDAPTHLAEHNNYLVFAFAGGSLQFSPLGEPGGTWTLKTGTASIGVGQEITAIKAVTGNLLAVWCENKINLLTGSSPTDFALEDHSSDVGAKVGSVAILNRPYFYDERGLTTLEATQNFGDFSAASFSSSVEPVLASIGSADVYAEVFREKNQYRLMWSRAGSTSTQGVICALKNEGLRGFTTFAYPFVLSCVCGSDISGTERIFAGAEDGYVYELDSGTSFDGAAIESYLRFPFNSLKSPRYRKRFRKLVIELECPEACNVALRESFDYDDPDTPPADEKTLATEAVGGFWNVAEWNNFVWGGPSVSIAEFKVSGTAKNLSIYLYTNLTYEQPYTIHGIALQYDIRRLER